MTRLLLQRIAHGLLGCVLLLHAAAVPARTILDLDVKTQPTQLLDWGDYLIDARGDATLQSILAQPTRFKPTLPRSTYALRPGETLWVRFTVPAAPDDQRWYVRLPSPGLDLATLHTLGGDDAWTRQSAGDSLPISSWALPHLYPVLPLSVSAAEPTRYVLKVQASDGFNAPIEFVSESRLSWEQQRMSLLYGVYFGLLAMGAFFALATAIALRDSAYLWFGLWSAAATLTAATAVGIAGLHFWPESPDWADAAHYVLPAISTVPFMLFVADALMVRERAPAIFWCACGLVAAVAACAWLAGTTDSPVRLYLSLATVATMTVAGMGLMAWCWHRGDRFARNLLVGVLPMAFALPLQLGVVIPRLGPGQESLWVVLLALALTISASYLLLALRSQERRDHRRRIAQLHEIDPTTGLVNDVVFARRMQELIDRAKRLGHHSVVAVVEFPNFAQLRSEFGRQHALELLLRLAERLSSILRSMDTVARLGDSRFGLLVDGPVAPSKTKAFGAKVVAHCLSPLGGLPQGMVVKPRIAMALVPGHGTGATAIIDQLDGLLREAAGDPARIILVAHTAATEPGPPSSGLQGSGPPASEALATAPSDSTGSTVSTEFQATDTARTAPAEER